MVDYLIKCLIMDLKYCKFYIVRENNYNIESNKIINNLSKFVFELDL